MRKTLALLAFLLISSETFAQNWNPITPGVRHYFTSVNGYLKGMEIDSVSSYGSDLHYYPYLRRQYDCGGWYIGNMFPDTIGSWLGRTVVKKTDGTFLFPNHWGDSILIKTLASTGDSWVFYHDNSSKYYTAEVTSVDTMTILGSIDSVKRILLHTYVNGNLAPSDSFDNTEIVLSKAHGFETIIELYYFPFHEPDTTAPVCDYFFSNALLPPGDAGNTIPVAGKTNGLFHLIDFADPSPAQFLDWNVGDIYQYDACFISMMTGWNSCDPPYNYRLDTIIGKTIMNNGVEYIRAGWQSKAIDSTGMFTHYSFVPTRDTVFFSNTGSYFFDTGMPEKWNGDILAPWPENLYYFDENDTTYYGNDSTCGLVSPAFLKYAFRGGLGGRSNNSKHKQGVGLVKCDLFSVGDFALYGHDDLIYSVRNGVPCGTYIFPDTSAPVVNSVTSVNEDAFKIYPNPAHEQLSIETITKSYNITLLNSIGQAVLTRNSCNGKQTVDLENYPSGVYILRITSSGGERSDQKIVIQH